MLFLLFYPEIIYIVICMYIHKQEIIVEVRDSLALSNIFYTFFCSEIQCQNLTGSYILDSPQVRHGRYLQCRFKN